MKNHVFRDFSDFSTVSGRGPLVALLPGISASVDFVAAGGVEEVLGWSRGRPWTSSGLWYHPVVAPDP